MSTVAENIKLVRDEISAAAIKCGRNADEIKIVAISKHADKQQVVEAINSGVSIFGESRPQQFEQRADWFKSVEVDFVGNLQRNKVKKVVPTAERIHSVDSLRLAEEINKEASKIGKTQKIFLQVNVSREKQKHGFPPKNIQEFVDKIKELENIKIIGLMTMAPQFAAKKETKRIFSQLVETRDNIRKTQKSVRFLSMGMSNDFIQAVEAGATHLRIGSAIFKKWEDN